MNHSHLCRPTYVELKGGSGTIIISHLHSMEKKEVTYFSLFLGGLDGLFLQKKNGKKTLKTLKLLLDKCFTDF